MSCTWIGVVRKESNRRCSSILKNAFHVDSKDAAHITDEARSPAAMNCLYGIPWMCVR